MTQIPDAMWLGLAARSESDQPHEWRPLLWTARNRMLSPGFPDTAAGVITQAWQFSYFSAFRDVADPDVAFTRALAGYAGDASGWSENDYTEAVKAAREVLNAGRWAAPFGPKVLNFWSPRSMVPAYSLPKWNWDVMRVFALGGIDPSRFLFAETVTGGHPLAGNVSDVLDVAGVGERVPRAEVTA